MIAVEDIVFPPSKLYRDIGDVIIAHLRDKYHKTCTQKHGYTMEIKRLIDFESLPISRASGELVIRVTYERDTLKPQEGDIFEAKILQITKRGIMLSVKDIFEIFIPAEKKLAHLTFDIGTGSYRNGETVVYKKDHTVDVKITCVIFKNQAYKCIGEPVESQQADIIIPEPVIETIQKPKKVVVKKSTQAPKTVRSLQKMIKRGSK